jgi:predicted Zn-dependent peptidase
VRGSRAIDAAELSRAKAALTRGYARHFETAEQLARASVQLLTYGLDDRTFDRFVPSIEAITADDTAAAAREFVHPDRAVAVVVGDPDHCRPQLEALGRPVADVTPEF